LFLIKIDKIFPKMEKSEHSFNFSFDPFQYMRNYARLA